MIWPFVRRSVHDALLLRLASEHEETKTLRQALGDAQIELRKLRLLVASQQETITQLMTKRATSLTAVAEAARRVQ